jgi:Mor family transcriptional regulator
MKEAEHFKSKGSELLLDLAQQVASTLAHSISVDEETAQALGRKIAHHMAAHWGGQNLYFPMGLRYRCSVRDEQIYQEFNGSNHSALARKYGVSLQWIYQILKIQHQAQRLRRERLQGI